MNLDIHSAAPREKPTTLTQCCPLSSSNEYYISTPNHDPIWVNPLELESLIALAEQD